MHLTNFTFGLLLWCYTYVCSVLLLNYVKVTYGLVHVLDVERGSMTTEYRVFQEYYKLVDCLPAQELSHYLHI